MTSIPTNYNMEYHISYNMKILFVGINPHYGSDDRGVPFSNNKMFWYLLSDSDLIDESRSELKKEDNLKKLYKTEFNSKYNLGIVNLIDRPTLNITLLKKDEEKNGVKRVTEIIKEYKPKIVVFIGKVTYKKFSGLKEVDYGWKENIFGSRVYLLHYPNRGKASIRIEELKILKKESENSQPKRLFTSIQQIVKINQ